MKPNGSFQQAPVRNASVVGAQVYSHNGEFSPQVYDFELPARGVFFQFIRKYRSANHNDFGSLGRGWTFSYAKWLEQEENDILFHDGFGRSHRFVFSADGSFSSPDGFYAVLLADGERVLLRQRFGDLFTFERPDLGGRILSIEDRNGNALKFEYRENSILATDPFERQIEIRFEQVRIVELRDHTQRTWQYAYNQDGCLVEVIQPPIQGLADRPVIRYEYDQDFRLSSITDPNGRTFLRNVYDEQGRIKTQHHGDGMLEFEYEPVGETDTGFTIYTTHVRLKNGSLLTLRHDQRGHVVQRSLFVSSSSLLPNDRAGVNEGTIPLITTSNYNRHSELIQRTYSAGDSTEWVYDEDNADARAQGNLLRVTQAPVPGSNRDVLPLVTSYTYESSYQQVKSVITPRGHTTTFEYDAHGNRSEQLHPVVTVQNISGDPSQRGNQQVRLSQRFDYNEAGQLIRVTNAGGATTEYFYYPPTDPTGARSLNDLSLLTQEAGSYLARIVQDSDTGARPQGRQPANRATGFGYDDVGNVTTILDGKGNPSRLEYDAHNHLISVTSRRPFNYATSFHYDANGNMIEGTLSFDHYDYDSDRQEVISKTTIARQSFEYNQLNNVVRRTIGTGEQERVQTFVRDAAENIVREIQPMGNAVEYNFDERNQVVARRAGAGTEEQSTIRYTYTLNGRLSSVTNGRDYTTLYHYDRFQRYEGFTNAGGVSKKQWRDEAGNVTRIEVSGEIVAFDADSNPTETIAQFLLESWFEYDELNRRVRVDRAWRDPLSGESLGQSQWDGTEGMVSSVVQYGDNHLPARVWAETGNILQIHYDGANRVRSHTDETGETVSIEYDENSNPIQLERLGPTLNQDEPRFRQVISQKFDELDRLVTRALNEDSPESFSYNTFGALTEYKNPAGTSVRFLQDTFGRSIGSVMTAVTAEDMNGRLTEQTILQRAKWDNNNRIIARINARGNATRYEYDALDRLKSIVYEDGATRQFERDAEGNITRVTDPNRTVITNRFDPLNRLIERQIEQADGRDRQVERYHYDGLNRLASAITGAAITVRRYDSLSRLLEETQSGRAIRYGYDSAGNQVSLSYPDGQEIQKTYDLLGRVVEVRAQGRLVASYTYGTSTQLHEQQFGDVLKVAFTYEPGKDWLSSVVYRSEALGEIIEGTSYRYDAAGNCIQEIQLRRGDDFGERYFYDTANRLVKVQYGVERLSDPNSGFEKEVLYELSPTGTWERTTTRDVNGQVLEQAEGATNPREAYESLGHRRFEYDANGNRVQEDNLDENLQKRYNYDYANRLERIESLTAAGQVVQTIEYAYDAWNRQVLKRMTRDGEVKEYVRVWNGSQLIEEWEGDKLVKSLAYGARSNEPLKLSVHREGESEEYFYVLKGRRSVAGLINQQTRLVEAYHYDVFGQPHHIDARGRREPFRASEVGNPLLAAALPYDADAAIYIYLANSYDPITVHTLGQKTSEPWAEGYVSYDGDEVDMGGMSGPGGVSIPGKDPYTGGKSDPFEPGIKYGNWWYFPAQDIWAWDPTEAEGWILSKGFGKVLSGIGKVAGLSEGGLWVLGKLVNMEDDEGGRSIGAQENKKKKKGAGNSGSPGSTSQGNKGSSSGRPEDAEPSNPNDKPSKDSPSYTIPESSDRYEFEKGHPEKEGHWVEDKGTGGKNMPNPEDRTGEGIDKDWWRGLPNASALDVVQALKSDPKVDEREGTVTFSVENMGGFSHLLSVLTPELITVDPGGESVSINLSGVHSDGTSTGTTTSDGWGDKPRSLAEAVAAPRIREGAIISRF
jgi:YD repeat-containing protein